MFTDILILAGGAGERLWPASDAHMPKQFMSLFEGRSFLQHTVLRALALDPPGKIWVVTRQSWVDLVAADIRALIESPGVGTRLQEKILVMGESRGRNTAPAAAWVCRCLLEQGADSGPPNVLVLPSDHIILDQRAFRADVQKAAGFSAQNRLMVFGIPPVYPETGYGYIRSGAALDAPGVFEAASFREKPDAQTAAAYIAAGDYFWNSGLYGFRADFFLEELMRYSPGVAAAFSDLGEGFFPEDQGGIAVITGRGGIEKAYDQTPSISIDYAVSEKSTRTAMVRASFDWDDVGSWDSLAKYPAVASKDVAAVYSAGNFVYSDIPVALCGVEDIVVVVKNGRALVMKKGFGYQVKEIASLKHF
ncbi:MAG: mannose-1-phosphate guanylyltransferase [Spirochaetaceae bacterium]|jgi:mannose-1-phosphate guanylyltransferase/mannose-6-phosphate isomerase|nr:mannose-1-phosphate guanylyltransferase [Spirochaetaceae bacterium]